MGALTEETMDYQVLWEGGDLGIALVPLASGTGVACSRVTGKGAPQGIENVAGDDVLLSINHIDTTHLTFNQVIEILKECDLPATIRFRKDLRKLPPSVTVDSSALTSPSGSSARATGHNTSWMNRKGSKDLRGSLLPKQPLFSYSYRPSSIVNSDTVVATPGAKSSLTLMDELNAATKEVDDEARTIAHTNVIVETSEASHSESQESSLSEHSYLSSEENDSERTAAPAVPVSISTPIHPSDILKEPLISDITQDKMPPTPPKTVSQKRTSKTITERNQLHQFCASGNLQSVVQHVRVKGWTDLAICEDRHGQNGLHLAVKSGNVQLVRTIVEQYEQIKDIINSQDSKGNTVMHFAASKTPEMVHLLHFAGAQVNIQNAQAFTPLVIAVITAKKDDVIIPRMLLKFGGDCNDMHQGQSILHTAIDRNMLRIGGALVHAGADMSSIDINNQSVFTKLNREALRQLIAQIFHPPCAISTKLQKKCMLCKKESSIRNRLVNCKHCGRVCCIECASLSVEAYQFPQGFPQRLIGGAANHEGKQVCKTCFNIFKERHGTKVKSQNAFIRRVIGVEWDEINPSKLAPSRAAGRRGILETKT